MMNKMKTICWILACITIATFTCGILSMFVGAIMGVPNYAGMDTLFSVARTSANIFIMCVVYMIYLKKK